MDVGIKIEEMTDEALNLFFGNDGSFRLRSAHVNGNVDIHAIGKRYEFRSILTGRQLQAVSGKDTTPPLDVDVEQTGIFDIGSRNLTFDKFDLRVAEHDHVRLAGELKHSLTINLGTEGAERKEVTAQNTPQADWMLTVNGI